MIIYIIIKKEFGFLIEKCNFKYKGMIKSNVHPSILYVSPDYDIQIGYNYEERYPFVYFWRASRKAIDIFDLSNNGIGKATFTHMSVSQSIRLIAGFVKNNMNLIDYKIKSPDS
jgi:hypothetical protein